MLGTDHVASALDYSRICQNGYPEDTVEIQHDDHRRMRVKSTSCFDLTYFCDDFAGSDTKMEDASVPDSPRTRNKRKLEGGTPDGGKVRDPKKPRTPNTPRTPGGKKNNKTGSSGKKKNANKSK